MFSFILAKHRLIQLESLLTLGQFPWLCLSKTVPHPTSEDGREDSLRLRPGRLYLAGNCTENVALLNNSGRLRQVTVRPGTLDGQLIKQAGEAQQLYRNVAVPTCCIAMQARVSGGQLYRNGSLRTSPLRMFSFGFRCEHTRPPRLHRTTQSQSNWAIVTILAGCWLDTRFAEASIALTKT